MSSLSWVYFGVKWVSYTARMLYFTFIYSSFDNWGVECLLNLAYDVWFRSWSCCKKYSLNHFWQFYKPSYIKAIHEARLINCVNIYCPSCISFKVRIQVFSFLQWHEGTCLSKKYCSKRKLFIPFPQLSEKLRICHFKKCNWLMQLRRKTVEKKKIAHLSAIEKEKLKCIPEFWPNFGMSAQTSSFCLDKTTWL